MDWIWDMRERNLYIFWPKQLQDGDIIYQDREQKGSSRSEWKMRNSALDELGLRCLWDIQIGIQEGIGYIIWVARDRTKLKK